MSIAEDSRTHAEQVAVRCATVARRIAERGARVRLASTLLRLAAALIGLAAVVVTYVPEIKAFVGTVGPYVSLFAALTLVVGSVVSILVSVNPPERYVDFARYIDYYDHRLREILSDESLSNPVRMARLHEVTALAAMNLNDVKAMWPWVED